VPLIIRGPGVRPDSWCHVPVVGYDFLPTFAEWADIPNKSLPKGIEGGSIASLLTHDSQGKVVRPREELVFHFPHYQSQDGPQSAIILGNLKLMKFYEDNRVALFDLSRDLSEQNDLASQMPMEAADLRKRLETYLANVDAQLPTRNPQYDPSRPLASGSRGRGGERGVKGPGMRGGRGGRQQGINGRVPQPGMQ
jgi:arylsulfatase A-like enzyme